MAGEEPDDEGHRTTVNLLAVIAALVIVIVGFWLIMTIRESVKKEECLMFGLRNCARIEAPSR